MSRNRFIAAVFALGLALIGGYALAIRDPALPPRMALAPIL